MTRPDVSILIPTHNRAESLRRTLRGIERCLRPEFSTEVVIIDNNCTDSTRQVVDDCARSIPTRYLQESEPGKNCALNRALCDAPLGELVVFTDDDIDPDSNWLEEIRATSARWPEHAVFGGKISVVWPDGLPVPDWAHEHAVQSFGFTVQDLGPEEVEYFAHHLPFGPNYWVRSRVFDDGRRFSTRIGPSSLDRKLGDETLFLLDLVRDGYKAVFSPRPRVGHRILPHLLTRRGIQRRAFELGLGIPHYRGLPRHDLLRRRPRMWRLLRWILLCRDYARYGLSWLIPRQTPSVLRGIAAMRAIGFNIECLRMTKKAPDTDDDR